MTLTLNIADSGLGAILDEDGPRFLCLDRTDPEVAESGHMTVSFERLWPVVLRMLRAGAFELDDLATFAEIDPTILESLRAAAVDAIMAAVYESPARRRRVLSNASRFRPLANFSLADQHDEDADILLLRALNLWTSNADVPALAILTERLLEADTVAIVPREA